MRGSLQSIVSSFVATWMIASAEEHTIYSSNQGSTDAKCGSLADPCRSFTQAWRARSARPGDHVQIILRDTHYTSPPLNGSALAIFRHVSLTIRSNTDGIRSFFNVSHEDGSKGPLQSDTSSSIVFKDLHIVGASLSCRHGACPPKLIFDGCSIDGDSQVFGGHISIKDTFCNKTSRLMAVDSKVESSGNDCEVLLAHLQLSDSTRSSLQSESERPKEGQKVAIIMICLVIGGLSIPLTIFFAIGKFSKKSAAIDEESVEEVEVVTTSSSCPSSTCSNASTSSDDDNEYVELQDEESNTTTPSFRIGDSMSTEVVIHIDEETPIVPHDHSKDES